MVGEGVFVPLRPGRVDFVREYFDWPITVSYNLVGDILGYELSGQVPQHVLDEILEGNNAYRCTSPGGDEPDVRSIPR